MLDARNKNIDLTELAQHPYVSWMQRHQRVLRVLHEVGATHEHSDPN